jgi:hypothetical protein
MVDEVDPADSTPADEPGRDRDPVLVEHPADAAGEVFALGPNLLSAVVGFVCLMAAPWVCQHIVEDVWEEAIGNDPIAALFIMPSLEEALVIAAAGSLLFLVIGAVLQVWQDHRPFSSRWPVVLAFPIAWGLFVPEALLRGGSFLSGALIGTAIAVAFSIQWASLVWLREAMD